MKLDVICYIFRKKEFLLHLVNMRLLLSATDQSSDIYFCCINKEFWKRIIYQVLNVYQKINVYAVMNIKILLVQSFFAVNKREDRQLP